MEWVSADKTKGNGNCVPAASTTTIEGLYNAADVAATSSPLKLLAPVPAMVVITFVLGLRLGYKVGDNVGVAEVGLML